MNINLVKLASSKKSRNKNDLSDRDSIIQNIIVNEIGNNVEVRKYDDDNDNIQVLSQLEIFDYVKMKFTRKISELKKNLNRKNYNRILSYLLVHYEELRFLIFQHHHYLQNHQ